MLSVVDIDVAIDGFIGAVTRAGLPAPSPPTDLSSMRELEAAIAPLRVPEPVRRFWQRVDPATLRARSHPGLHGTDFALRCWRSARDEFTSYQPLALLQIAYESHQCTSVELDQPGIAGGALLEWTLADGGFERRFAGLQGWLVSPAELLLTGRFAVHEL